MSTHKSSKIESAELVMIGHSSLAMTVNGRRFEIAAEAGGWAVFNDSGRFVTMAANKNACVEYVYLGIENDSI